MLIFNEIPSAFPWVDKLEKTNHYRRNCADELDYKLIAPKDALLPFQYKRPIDVPEVTGWKIRGVRNDGLTGNIIDLAENLALIKTATFGTNDYFYYGGGLLLIGGNPLGLLYGYYNSYLEFSDGSKAYSEMFFIPENSFSVDDDEPEYLKLTWYHMAGDIAPFYYSDLLGGTPVFKNIAYLDTFITESQPVITQTTVKDGNDTDIPVFQKATIPYKINLFVPDFLKKALVLTQLHDTIFLASSGGVFSGQINSITTQLQTENPGCMSNVDLIWEQDLAIVNRTCATNLIPTASAIAYNYFIIDETTPEEHFSHNLDGQIVVTSSLLTGKSGYGVFATQIPNFIAPDLITYDRPGGKFTITAPGFDLAPGAQLFVFYNLLDVTLFP